MDYKYPVYKPNLSGNEKTYVLDCLDTTWISSKGGYIQKFESSFADYVGSSYAASVCNGTVAIHLALVALGIGPEDEVIVPTLTYISSVNCIAYTGARPVFVDSDKASWQMDTNDVRKKITPKTKAILCVHLYGSPCNMDELLKIAEENRLFLIEDCAEAIGTKFNNKHVGTFGHIGTFSFFGNKAITTGEGGMVVTQNKDLHEKLVHFKGQGLAKGREYWHDVVGYNYRMTNICAAIGLAQMERIQNTLENKTRIASIYKDKLSSLPVLMHTEQPNTNHSYWMVSVLVDEMKRDLLRHHLSNNGIETRPLFFPAHTMPMYFDKSFSFPVAEHLSARGINLPSYPDLTGSDIQYICDCIADFFNN
jgi:perosamine synthetase